MLENIHDKFFRKIFSEIETTRSFLQNYLPPEIVAILDLEKLEIEKDSFVDQNLKDSYSDLLCKTKLSNTEGWIYLLFEHKSYPDKFTPLQLLRYIMAIWEKELKEKNSLSPIIPLVLYHGENSWQKLSLREIINHPKELAQFIPHFDYLFYDLSQYPEEALKGGLLVKATLFTLKYIFSEGLEEKLPQLLEFLNSLQSSRKLDYIRLFLYYVTGGAPKVHQEKLITTIKEGLGEDVMPVIAEEWIKEGIEKGIKLGREEGLKEGLEKGLEKGREEGIYEAKLQAAENFLKLGVELSIVLQATGLSRNDLEKAGILPKE